RRRAYVAPRWLGHGVPVVQRQITPPARAALSRASAAAMTWPVRFQSAETWSASGKDSLLSSGDTKTYFARARVRDSRENRHPGKSSLALHNNLPLGSTGRWPVVRGSLPRTSLAPKAR